MALFVRLGCHYPGKCTCTFTMFSEGLAGSSATNSRPVCLSMDVEWHIAGISLAPLFSQAVWHTGITVEWPGQSPVLIVVVGMRAAQRSRVLRNP